MRWRTLENSSVAGVVRAVVFPLVMRYRSGVCGLGGFSGIFPGVGKLATLLECSDSLLEMKYLPKGDPYIQKADACNCSAHPSRSNHGLQRMHPGFSCSVQKKIVVTPVAQSKRALRYPGQ